MMSNTDKEVLVINIRRMAKLIELDAPSATIMKDFALLVPRLMELLQDQVSAATVEILDMRKKLKRLEKIKGGQQ